MLYVDNNSDLWKDEQGFDLFKQAVSLLSTELTNDPRDIEQIKLIADGFDQIFQTYEEKHGDMEDPLFYWWFATANAILTPYVSDNERFTRTQYAVNGYKTGLSRHRKNPSYSMEMIDKACNIIAQLKPGDEGPGWVEKNKHAFEPIP